MGNLKSTIFTPAQLPPRSHKICACAVHHENSKSKTTNNQNLLESASGRALRAWSSNNLALEFNAAMSDQNMNNLMREIGNPGKFQVLIFILISVNFMIMLPTHLAMVFFAAKTTHHCKVGSGQNISDVIPTIVRDNMKQWDSCSMFKNGSKTETMSCNNGWTYYMEERERTIISEVCDGLY